MQNFTPQTFFPFAKNVAKKSVTQGLAAAELLRSYKSASAGGMLAKFRCGALRRVTESFRDDGDHALVTNDARHYFGLRSYTSATEVISINFIIINVCSSP